MGRAAACIIIAVQVSYELISAVQDLYDLYLRCGPAGPYRLELFHGASELRRSWPDALRRDSELLDRLIRGVSCLMANDLAEAALPLISELWRAVRNTEKRVTGRSGPDPDFFRYISFELSVGIPQAESGAPVDRSQILQKAYLMFGEVLAVYLDLIAVVRGDEDEIPAKVSQLRGRLALGRQG